MELWEIIVTIWFTWALVSLTVDVIVEKLRRRKKR